MGKLTIYFVGICTHFPSKHPGPYHRVVLVNASHGYKDISEHHARFRVDPEFIVRGTVPQLDGVSISIDHVEHNVRYDDDYSTCVPHLTRCTKEHIDPEPKVIDDGDPDKALLYFDFAGGNFSAGKAGGGEAVACVEVTTSQTNPTLTIKPFGGGAPHTLELRDGAEIQIENVGAKTDDDRDFLLHFRTMKREPQDADWPKEIECAKTITLPFDLDPPNTVGPGCSNSSYP